MRKNSTISAVNLKKDFGSLRIVVTGLLDDINKIEELKYHDAKTSITERKKIKWLDRKQKYKSNPKTCLAMSMC
jgi:hypothetical protein